VHYIQGKHAYTLDAQSLRASLRACNQALLDIGTGDGRFVIKAARERPDRLAIGLDACREAMGDASRRAPTNALFVLANANALPGELRGVAAQLTINFPWGSLLAGLLSGEPSLLEGVVACARPGAALEVRLNGGALAEAGWDLAEGAAQVRRGLREAGFAVAAPQLLDASALRACPTTWAKRLAFGRDPRALYLRAVAPCR
jgi:16S rRNA (adenine(1408)-N(1))-methyltransferase